MNEKSTFARHVRAAKPRATKHEVRDDMLTRLAVTRRAGLGPSPLSDCSR